MTFIILIVLAVAGFFAYSYYRAQNIPRPPHVNNSEIIPCPSDPNCVSTVDTDEKHGMQPIPYTTSMDEAKAKLLGIIAELPKAEVVTNEGNYVYVETRSPTMGFPDDVQFIFDDAAKEIQFRSAARMGKGDLDKNRERMEHIRDTFTR